MTSSCYFLFKSLDFTYDLQIRCRNLTTWQVTRVEAPSMAVGQHALFCNYNVMTFVKLDFVFAPPNLTSPSFIDLLCEFMLFLKSLERHTLISRISGLALNEHDNSWLRNGTHWGLVKPIYISKLNHLWFRWWLIASLVPRPYLRQCQIFLNWIIKHTLKWNSNQNTTIFRKWILKLRLQNDCHFSSALMC